MVEEDNLIIYNCTIVCYFIYENVDSKKYILVTYLSIFNDPRPIVPTPNAIIDINSRGSEIKQSYPNSFNYRKIMTNYTRCQFYPTDKP